eukprot:2145-Heterococcus_DN1.PRE.1
MYACWHCVSSHGISECRRIHIQQRCETSVRLEAAAWRLAHCIHIWSKIDVYAITSASDYKGNCKLIFMLLPVPVTTRATAQYFTKRSVMSHHFINYAFACKLLWLPTNTAVDCNATAVKVKTSAQARQYLGDH